MAKKTLLALDISSSSTGYAVFRNGRFVSARKNFGLIQPPKKYSLPAKLQYFRSELIKLLEEVQPSRVAAEDVHHSFARSTIILSRFSGVAIEAVFSWGDKLEIELITPAEARAAANTGQSKESAFLNMQLKYKLNNWTFKTTSDITDAIVVGLGVLKRSK